MATRTTNYGLYKPEPTDPTEDFLTEFGYNMDEIDSHLGGGSGGHTIIDENGQTMTQRTGLEFMGNVQITDDSVNNKTIVEIVGGGGSEDVELTVAEYIALPDTKLTDDKNYFIKDINNDNVLGYPPLIYSDGEREVGVWRDGKPLYQKTFIQTFNNIASGTETNMADVSGLNIDELADITGRVNYYNGTDWFNVNLGTYFGAYVHTNGYLTFLQTMTGQTTNRSYIVVVTLRYTKTTDTPGSGVWNGQGGIAHHYSTNETVIGTWFGKPLYEKTIEQNNIMMGINGGTSTTLAHNISNLKECVDLQMCCPKLGYYTKDILSSSTGNVFAHFSVNSTNIYCTGGSNYFGATADRYWYFKIRYTKTTD